MYSGFFAACHGSMGTFCKRCPFVARQVDPTTQTEGTILFTQLIEDQSVPRMLTKYMVKEVMELYKGKSPNWFPKAMAINMAIDSNEVNT